MAEAEFSGEEVDAILVPKDSVVRTSRGNFIYVINPSTEGESLSVRQHFFGSSTTVTLKLKPKEEKGHASKKRR